MLCHSPAVVRIFRDDDRGFVVSIELILMATIAILGLIVSFTSIRDGVVSELSDLAGSVQDLNQCYEYLGVEGHSGTSHGSDFADALDHCDDADDTAGAADNCVTFDVAPTDESDGSELAAKAFTVNTDRNGIQNGSQSTDFTIVTESGTFTGATLADVQASMEEAGYTFSLECDTPECHISTLTISGADCVNGISYTSASTGVVKIEPSE